MSGPARSAPRRRLRRLAGPLIVWLERRGLPRTAQRAALTALVTEARGLQSRLTSRSRSRLMPLGDSITLGAYGWDDPGQGGYRAVLWRLLAAEGRPVDFVGSLRDGPPEVDREHEGHAGWRLDQLAASVEVWLRAFRPDLVLLQAGTNDLIQGASVAEAGRRLDRLLDRLATGRPGPRVLVAPLCPARPGNDYGLDPAAVAAFNAAGPALVAAGGGSARWVELWEGGAFTDADLGPDGVHPSPSGYRRLAAGWHRALAAEWPG